MFKEVVGLTISKFIYKKLKQKKLRQVELAEWVGISRQLLHHKLKTGNFSPAELTSVARFFGYKLSEFFREMEPKTKGEA